MCVCVYACVYPCVCVCVYVSVCVSVCVCVCVLPECSLVHQSIGSLTGQQTKQRQHVSLKHTALLFPSITASLCTQSHHHTRTGVCWHSLAHICKYAHTHTHTHTYAMRTNRHPHTHTHTHTHTHACRHTHTCPRTYTSSMKLGQCCNVAHFFLW